MSIRILSLFTVLISFHLCVAQTTEDFEDETLGNTPDLFTPAWTGNSSLFILVDESGDKQLRSNAGDLVSAMDYNISIPSTDITDFTWEFFIDLKFNPSGANYVDVFLTSDNSDLASVQNGYYVRIGDTEDWIALHKIVSGTRTPDGSPLLSTSTGVLNSSSSKPYKIRVIRDGSGNWELLTDADVTGSFTSHGTINDTDVATSSHFGIFIEQSGAASPADNHFFDDISITSNNTPDTDPPTIQSVTAISDTEVDVLFNENVDQIIAETSTNYAIDGSISVITASRDVANNALVHLTTSSMINGTTYTITINNIEDESSNVIVLNSQEMFDYLVFEEAVEFDVVINEFLADPNPPIGLPDAEFVELYNRSTKFFDLANWELDGQSLPTFQFNPDSYVIVCEDDDLALFSAFSNVLAITTLSLNNSSADVITLEDDNAGQIHSISFTGSVEGTSTELINPNGPDYSSNNYGLSIDPDGGTPGEQNSIFDDTPDTTKPTIAGITVITSIAIDVSFDEPIDETSAEVSGNYSIDGGISVSNAMLDESDNTLVHLTVSTLISGEIRTLTINNIEDLSGNVIVANSTIDFEYIEPEIAEVGDVIVNEFHAVPAAGGGIPNAEFVELLNVSSKFIDLENWTLSDASSTSSGFPSHILRPNDYVILAVSGEGSLFNSFGDVVEVSSFPALNNTGDDIRIANASSIDIFSISYNSATTGVSSELVNPNDPCLSELSFEESTSSEGGTPGAQNSVFDDTPDTTPPTVVSTNFDDFLTINFSETMDETSLINGNYTISNLSVSDVVTTTLPMSVNIFFTETPVSGIIYELTISGVEDCWGNAIVEATVNFGLGRAPAFNEILITEILSDPEPSVGLPEEEYIEIYNATSDLISTEDLVFADANGTTTLPSVTLDPLTYYVLASPSDIDEFPGVMAIGVSSFPSLSNGGEQLYLLKDDDLIFSVEYSSDWHEEEKSDGGYSLEMQDLSNPCVEEFNWVSSVNPSGGTPGMSNSLNESVPDNFGPRVEKATVQSASIIVIDFDENLDPSSVSSGAITFEPSLNISSIEFNYAQPKSLLVTLIEDLVENTPHTFELSNIADCNGNEVQENDIVIALPSESSVGDVLLSEVLFNPRTNGVDFVELYNSSAKFISLNGWEFARVTETGIDDEKSISDEELVIAPGDYLAFSTDAEILFNNYPQGVLENFRQVGSLPTYSNDSGNVVLINHLGEVHELFHYEDDYHYDLLESTDGVSLERISFEGEINDPNNWRSASSVVGFATPGASNSQAVTNQTVAVGAVEVEPKVFIPGNSGSGRDFTTINYQFDQPGKFANITIYDQTGRLIKSVAEGALLSTSGFVRWDGTTNSGEMARLGYYVVLFEVFDSTGNSDVIKETVVVGRDF